MEDDGMRGCRARQPARPIACDHYCLTRPQDSKSFCLALRILGFNTIPRTRIYYRNIYLAPVDQIYVITTSTYSDRCNTTTHTVYFRKCSSQWLGPFQLVEKRWSPQIPCLRSFEPWGLRYFRHKDQQIRHRQTQPTQAHEVCRVPKFLNIHMALDGTLLSSCLPLCL
ncbi:hypothetical protein BO94DRAFT_215293 [Aspergillus sclerotioniger CBS 115572]|uniref:Uncharacterized protein n=1 Tax=Aspergillus sclerotioniger CBS 115572 TaxID=1450535 RepID=A0A317X9D0_9EURO|nr:hypothetical protein BO94DRAFT_215293 [Aspergillus sclerotioniger CBS 115572]PWY94965.1 hypothetical protein BO94DRAFT_215293 [Aspergillus sclerotioniger CBS 115572]